MIKGFVTALAVLIFFCFVNELQKMNPAKHDISPNIGAVQVSRDQDGGRGGVCQMITLDHKGEGGVSQMIT